MRKDRLQEGFHSAQIQNRIVIIFFPYDETPDQIRAIEEIKAAMEFLKEPSDRLPVRDVGYGKTQRDRR